MTKDRRTTCLQCNKPITQTQGRRERKFCPDSNCGQLHWLSTHPKESRFKRIPIEEYEKLKLALNGGGRDNQFTNAARGRDKSGVNEDELKSIIHTPLPTNNKEQVVVDKPKTLNDIKLLCPKSLSGFDRSEWISKERLKYGI